MALAERLPWLTSLRVLAGIVSVVALASCSGGAGSGSASGLVQRWARAVNSGDTERACALMETSRGCPATVRDLHRDTLKFKGPASSGAPLAPGDEYFSFDTGSGTLFVTAVADRQSFKVRIELTVVR